VLFDDNPSVKAVFRHPKECYARKPSPTDASASLAAAVFATAGAEQSVRSERSRRDESRIRRTIGTLMKQDFQRAVLNCIPLIDINHLDDRGKSSFLCDEYQSFVTVGESDGGREVLRAIAGSHVHSDRRRAVDQLLTLDAGES